MCECVGAHLNWKPSKMLLILQYTWASFQAYMYIKSILIMYAINIVWVFLCMCQYVCVCIRFSVKRIDILCKGCILYMPPWTTWKWMTISESSKDKETAKKIEMEMTWTNISAFDYIKLLLSENAHIAHTHTPFNTHFTYMERTHLSTHILNTNIRVGIYKF